MLHRSITVEQLLANYWLNSENKINLSEDGISGLRQFVTDSKIPVSDDVLKLAENHLNSDFANGDVDQWVVLICFLGHPHALWNFLIEAVAIADSDEKLDRVAVELVEHILAHYGSMLPFFEKRAVEDPKFKRMLTGAWRHRMSDDVWMRLRSMQSDVPNPLPNMIPIQQGKNHMANALSEEDRNTDDKGPYLRDSNGDWQMT